MKKAEWKADGRGHYVMHVNDFGAVHPVLSVYETNPNTFYMDSLYMEESMLLDSITETEAMEEAEEIYKDYLLGKLDYYRHVYDTHFGEEKRQ